MGLFKRRRKNLGSPNTGLVTTESGKVIGFWFEDAYAANDDGLLDAVLVRYDLVHYLGRPRRLVANTVDDRGGMFVMFENHQAPGETTPPVIADLPTTTPSIQVNGESYPLHETFHAFAHDAAEGRIALLKTTFDGISMDDTSRLFDVLAEAFGDDSPETRAVVSSGIHCLTCFHRHSIQRVYLRELAKDRHTAFLSPHSELRSCVKCGSEQAVWLYDPAQRSDS